MFVPIEPLWLLFKKLTKRGVRVKFLTEITNENLSYSKDIMEYGELRHVDDIKFGRFWIIWWIKVSMQSCLNIWRDASSYDY